MTSDRQTAAGPGDAHPVPAAPNPGPGDAGGEAPLPAPAGPDGYLRYDGPCPACGHPRVRVAVCLCDHTVSYHRIDLKRACCERPGCGCRQFREKP